MANLQKYPEGVANIMNNYYVNVAADIGKAKSLNGMDITYTCWMLEWPLVPLLDV